MNKKMIKIVLIVIVSPILLILGCRLMIETIGFISTTFFPDHQQDRWKERTTPLSEDQVQSICHNFQLEDDPLCNSEEVYGPEFYQAIVDTLHPEEEFSPYGVGSAPARYDMVEDKLGAFKVRCGEVINEPDYLGKYFICDYDLRGDGQFILGILFRYPEMTVFRITTPMGGDW